MADSPKRCFPRWPALISNRKIKATIGAVIEDAMRGVVEGLETFESVCRAVLDEIELEEELGDLERDYLPEIIEIEVNKQLLGRGIVLPTEDEDKEKE